MPSAIFSAEESQRIAADYANGANCCSLAIQEGVSRTAIVTAIRRAGGAVRSSAEECRKRRKADYTGQQVGDFFVEGYRRDPASGRMKWHCVCACGARRAVNARYFETGNRRCWDCSRSGGRTRGLSAAERRARYGNCLYSVDESAFEGEVTERMAYFAGLLITDGFVSHNAKTGGKSVGVNLQADDVAILEELREFLKSSHPIHFYTSTRPKTGAVLRYTRLLISSTRLVDSVARFGVVPHKTHTAVAPDFVLNNRHWWRGCVDGDGMITSNSHGKPTFGLCGTKSLVTQFAEYLRQTITFRAGVRRDKSIWCLYVSGQAAVEGIRLLYEGASVSLARKQAAATDVMRAYPG